MLTPAAVPLSSERSLSFNPDRQSLTGIAPGTLVDVSWTVTEKKPYFVGDFYDSWNVTTGTPVRRSRLIADFPASLTPRLVEDHLDFTKQITNANGRRVYLWARKDVPMPKGNCSRPTQACM